MQYNAVIKVQKIEVTYKTKQQSDLARKHETFCVVQDTVVNTA